MRTTQLADKTVNRVGYGAMQLEKLDRDAAVRLLRSAFDAGVNHVDTADFYGDGLVNDHIAHALRPDDDVLVATKVGAAPNPGGRIPLKVAQRPEEIRASVEENLRTLRTERLALVNLRRTDMAPGLIATGDQVVDLDDQLAVLTELRTEGKVGAIGLSHVSLQQLDHASPVGIACVQNSYSLVSREDEEVLDRCRTEGIAWVPYFPLGGAFPGLPKVGDEPVVHEVAGRLGVSASQVGLAWLLHHSPNTLLIPGTSDEGHLAQNLAVADVELDAATMAALDAVPSRRGDFA